MTAAALPPPVFVTFAGEVVRIVESQEQVATTRIVDNLVEQDLLESMIEDSKPGASGGRLHYLLSTPFRYPPLRHGSRFGSRLEPSLFYASLDTGTCLQECAYYRLLLWHDMTEPPPLPIETQHTLFTVQLDTPACVDLTKPPFESCQDKLRSPGSYDYTHRLGAHYRDLDTQALLFESARSPGVNVALYTAQAFASGPLDQSLWNSQLSSDRVYFRGWQGVFHYPLTQFADDSGQLIRVR